MSWGLSISLWADAHPGSEKATATTHFAQHPKNVRKVSRVAASTDAFAVETLSTGGGVGRVAVQQQPSLLVNLVWNLSDLGVTGACNGYAFSDTWHVRCSREARLTRHSV